MKIELIYSISIYIILYIIIIIQKPYYLYDNNNKFKSINYLNYKIKNKIINYDDYINLPIIATFFAIISVYISKNIII